MLRLPVLLLECPQKGLSVAPRALVALLQRPAPRLARRQVPAVWQPTQVRHLCDAGASARHAAGRTSKIPTWSSACTMSPEVAPTCSASLAQPLSPAVPPRRLRSQGGVKVGGAGL